MTVKITIKGPIVSSDEKWIYSWFGEEATCAKDVSSALPKSGEDVEVEINSYGGYVDQGAEIYTILRNHPGKVSVNIVGAAYSAASIIAMAGDTVRISPVGRMMIHNGNAEQYGDYHDMDKMSEILQLTNQSMCNAYVSKTGLSKEDILAKMDAETWLTAEEAVDQGFADEIMFESKAIPRLVASTGNGMLPGSVIAKIRETMKEQVPAPIQSGVVEVEPFDLDALADKVAMKLKGTVANEPDAKVKSLLNKLKREV